MIAAIAVAARFWVSWRTHATGEDALITLRYAENIARGHGFTYNSGEHVLGTTTPLYTLILALAALLHLNAMNFGKIINILADGGTCYLVARLLGRFGWRFAGLFAALLYALSSTPISISISGMETGLVTCVGMGMLHAYLAGKIRLLYILGAILFLLRIDGLLLFFFLAVASMLMQRRFQWREMLLAIMIVLPWLIFCSIYFGSAIPESVLAKLTVYRLAPPDRHVITAAFQTQFLLGGFQKLITLLAVVGAIKILLSSYTVLSLRKSASETHSSTSHEQAEITIDLQAGAVREGDSLILLIAPLLWLILYLGTMYRSSVPVFGWYFLPVWPFFLFLAALGGSQIVRLLTSIVSRFFPRSKISANTDRVSISSNILFAILGMCGIFGIYRIPVIEAQIASLQRVEDEVRRPLGIWFHQNARPEERILLEPIGYVGYYSDRRVLDMIGLVSPEALSSYRTRHYLTEIVQRLRPEWLCLRPSEIDKLLSGDPQILSREYDYIRFAGGTEATPNFRIYHRKQAARD